MIRWIATVAAGVALSAALVGSAATAPQSAPATSQSLQQPDVDPAPLTPPAPPGRKPHAGGSRSAAWEGNVMRGGDTASLVATLPWWRTDARAPGSDPGELESPILTACDVWLGFPFATADIQSLTVRLWEAQNLTDITLVTNKIRVADAGELNEIDLAALDTTQGSGKSWLGGLLALFGGALAAFSAVRYLAA